MLGAQGVSEGNGRPPLAVIVGTNIWRLRQERGMSRGKLSRLADLDPRTLKLVEQSRDQDRATNFARLDTLERIASALGVEPAELLRWDPEATRVFLHGRASLSLIIAG